MVGVSIKEVGPGEDQRCAKLAGCNSEYSVAVALAIVFRFGRRRRWDIHLVIVDYVIAAKVEKGVLPEKVLLVFVGRR